MAGIFGAIFAQHAVALLGSVVLLLLSSAFSSGETALFSLSAPELNRIRAGRTGSDRIIATLHANLSSLLPILLFSNMAVNVLMFAITASIASGLGDRFGAGATVGFSLASLFLVVFFGEVFPKQMAIAASLTVARITSPLIWIFFRILARPMRILSAVVAGLERIFVPSRTDRRELQEEELRLLVELSHNDGVISEGEYKLIDGIVELPDVKVRDIMVPRVDVASLDPDTGSEQALAEARRLRHCKLPVMDPESDEMLGWVDVRDIYADGMRAGTGGSEAGLGVFLRDFQYFSEHDRADQVLERIKKNDGGLFAVVDERGTVIGFFTLQDIMDEVLGHFGEHGAAPAQEIREIPGGYVLSGRLSVREWRDLFNVSDAVPKSATVGGLVVSLLGRIPRPGDRVTLGNTEMTVLSTWHNRVTEVELRLLKGEARPAAQSWRKR